MIINGFATAEFNNIFIISIIGLIIWKSCTVNDQEEKSVLRGKVLIRNGFFSLEKLL